MLHGENAQTDRVLNILEELHLRDGETEIVEEYLRGEAGEEILAGLSPRNTTTYFAGKYRLFQELFETYVQENHKEEASRLLRLLYAMGAYNCCDCFENPEIFMDIVENGTVAIDRGKAVAIAAQYIFLQVYRLNTNHRCQFLTTRLWERLVKFAERSPEIVLQAWKEFDQGQINGRILLMALYFYLRCDRDGRAAGEIPPQLPQQAEQGLKSAPSLPSEFQGSIGERALFSTYEETLTELLRMILKAEAAGKKEIRDIQEGILQGKWQDSLLQGIQKWAVNVSVFELITNCASINYMFSEKLRNVLRVCASLNPSRFLDALVRLDPREELGNMAGKMEELFCISDPDVMSWLLVVLDETPRFGIEPEKVKAMILPAQYRKNPQQYLLAYRKANSDLRNALAGTVRDEAPEVYRQVVMPQAASQKERIIFRLTEKEICARECRDYLKGLTELSALYAIRGKLVSTWYKESDARKALERYYEAYREEEFYARCMAYMALRHSGHFFNAGFIGKSREACEEVLEHTFRGMTLAGVGLAEQIQVVCRMVDEEYSEKRKEEITHRCIPVFRRYLVERPQETENALAGAEAYGRYFALLVYNSAAQDGGEATAQEDAWQAQILFYSQDSSKLVRQELEKMLAARPGWRSRIMELLSSKKSAEREMGIRVLAGWNTPLDREALQALYEKEKSAKLRALLDTVLNPDSTGAQGKGGSGSCPALNREDLVKNLHKGGKKRSLAWACETPFSPVHKRNKEAASEEYLQALLLCYSSMSRPGINKDAALLAEELEDRELAIYVCELFDKWMEAGAEAKKRWVLYASSIHGGGEIIKRLYHQIQEWPRNARGAIAAEAVQALALSPQPQALLLVDGIARKFKYGQVKNAAGQALEFAANQLGLTREQLEDKIVPSLGFDERRERHFDYGNRSFTVTITPALEVEIFDGNGKKLKNMPAPGSRDDEKKAAAAYAAFKEMKKQMKTTVSSQKQRLETALSTERLWTPTAWRELFVGNPIMHQFAIGLIWGVYVEHRLERSFRYMEDGSFNTEDEEEYILPQSASEPPVKQVRIGLVHPLELSEESLETWKQQMEDYEITQPVEQLDRTVYRLTPKEQKARSLERFGGMIINDLSLGSKLTALGWHRGSVQDAFCFCTYYREDVSLGLGAELHFSGSVVGGGSMGGENVTVYDVRFYRTGTAERGAYCCDEAKGIPLRDIPSRYFSEIVWQLTKATASSKERSQTWKPRA